MIRLNKTYIDPTKIQTFKPQQLAVVVNYSIHNGKQQAWIMCDEHPFQIFIIPERDGYPLSHIFNCLDQHFDNLVFYPSQQQFIKSYSIKSMMQQNNAAKFSVNIDFAEVGKNLAMKVITILGKVIRIGYEILKLATKDILLLAGFAGKQLIRLFLSLLAVLVDSYEAIPMKEEAVIQRERAENIRDYIQKLDDINIAGSAGDINKDALQKIVAIVKDEVQDSQEYKDDFMKNLDRDIPMAPHMGQRVRM